MTVALSGDGGDEVFADYAFGDDPERVGSVASDGEALAFAFIYNGRDLWRARTAIDAMGVALAVWLYRVPSRDRPA